MSRTTNESDDGVASKDHIDSPSISLDEGSSGGSGGVTLKKGPWTSAEDAILVDYVKKHGEGNWNAVQKQSGLFRCGKSCRLRWANHLRPNLKKGAFTVDEERLIIELHAKMGNKWARMAAHLPGRTDNEIKNYWNTRIKRRQRAGLPLYPPDVCLQAVNESKRSSCLGPLGNADPSHCDLPSNLDVPDVIFEHLKTGPGTFPYPPVFHDVSLGSMLSHGLEANHSYSMMASSISQSKTILEPELSCPGFSGSLCSSIPCFENFPHEVCEKIHSCPFGPSDELMYDSDSVPKCATSYDSTMTGSHAFSNGNFPTSEPFLEAMKLELPSLQYLETDMSMWATPGNPPPSLEAVDAYIQSPALSAQVHCDPLSHRNSGLLDALLHESQMLCSGKNKACEKSSSSCVVSPDAIDSSGRNSCVTDWEDYGDPISPLGRSATSVFSDCTLVGGSSLDESLAGKTFSSSEIRETCEQISPSDWGDKETSAHLDFSRPDVLLNADFFYQRHAGKDLMSLLGNVCNDYRHTASMPITRTHGRGLTSCAWNSMSTMCQMAKLT